MHRAVWLIVAAELLGTSLWFSGNHAIGELAREWDLQGAEKGWLLLATQLGFIVGTLGVSLSGLADAFPSNRIFAVCALVGAAANAGFGLLADDLETALTFRFVTGLALAGVYPLGMKLVVTWAPGQGGAALGWLVGALAMGAGVPFLATALAVSGDWEVPVLVSSALATLSAVMIWGLGEGPARKPTVPMSWSRVWAAFRVPNFRASAFGYFGHMWELYAFWALVPLLVALVGDDFSVAWGSFGVIAAGACGCVIGGKLSGRVGSAAVAGSALAVSALMCALSPALGLMPGWLALLALGVWGFAVVADSPQFSAMSAKYCPPESVGSALAVQNAVGFSITLASIPLTQALWEEWGAYTPWVLFPGPVLGRLAMRRLFRR